jgi:hypothetical protein
MFAMLNLGFVCNNNRTGTNNEPPQTQVAIQFQLKTWLPKEFASKPYDDNVTWYGELISATGEDGNADSYEIPKPYSGTVDMDGSYVVSLILSGQRAGTWSFKVDGGAGWTANCQLPLEPTGTVHNVNFTRDKDGCKTGLDFP